MRSKIVVIITLVVITVIFSSIMIENPRLVDRGLYRLGFQEQVCVAETHDSDFKNITNIAIAGDLPEMPRRPICGSSSVDTQLRDA